MADDGVGGANEVMSSGLQGLRDRVEAIGGTFELESPPGRGTRVVGGDPGDGRGPHRQWMRALMAISTPPMAATASACTTQASGRAPASRPAA